MAGEGSATIPASTVNLVKSMLGSGILCLPYIFGQTGLLLGVVVLWLCAFTSAFGVHVLAVTSLAAVQQGKDGQYMSLAHSAFGGRALGGAIVSSCVFVDAFGAAVAYLIVIGDLVPELCTYLALDHAPWNSRMFWITAIGWFVEFPLCTLQNLDSLKISSLIGTVGILYIVVVICILAYGAVDMKHPEQVVSFWPPPKSQYTSFPGMMQSIPICIFAFGCCKTIPDLVCELREATVRRVDIVVVAASAISASLYMLMGVCGSLAFGASVSGNSLESFPNDQGTTGGLVSVFARVATVVNVMGTFPLCSHPLRAMTSQMIFHKAPSKLSKAGRISLTFGIFLSAWGSAMVLEDLDQVLALCGSIGGLMAGFTLPALFLLCLSRASGGEGADFGISSQNAEEGARSIPINSTLQRASMVMAALSAFLIPVLVGTELYKMFHVTAVATNTSPA